MKPEALTQHAGCLILPSTPQPPSNILHLPLRFDKDYSLVSLLLRHLIEQLTQPTENKERGMKRNLSQ